MASGYLGPFVVLRLTLIDLAAGQVVHSAVVSDGVLIGPPAAEAPDPWRFITLEQKAIVVRDLLRKTLERGTAQLLNAAR